MQPSVPTVNAPLIWGIVTVSIGVIRNFPSTGTIGTADAVRGASSLLIVSVGNYSGKSV